MAGLNDGVGGDGDYGGDLVRRGENHESQNGPAGAHALKGNYNAYRQVASLGPDSARSR